MVAPPHVGPSSSAAAAAASRPNGASTSAPAPTQTRSKTGTTSHSANMAPHIPLSARRAEPLDMSTVERRHGPLLGWKEPASRAHISGIPEAPTYLPSEEEWANPMEYIRKISPEGRKYGIVKVVPPSSWNPTFAIDSEVSLKKDLSEGTMCTPSHQLLFRFTQNKRSFERRAYLTDVRSASIFAQEGKS